MQSLLVFYDGKCPLCVETKRRLEQLDWWNRLEWKSIHENGVIESYFFLSEEAVQASMHLLVDDTYVYHGFSAVRRIMLALPLTSALALLSYLPMARPLGERLYAWVAYNRYRFKKEAPSCNDGLCQIQQKQGGNK
ncbi:thiol-disulfide oxidoreductase DCC family protein [Salsuginibacillus kocurii]|uniref:thiol-disulfide oxidoreductase DCC family protein n=1 Tax=Salsuginibacillus kocurii TaxID=427078 RepID=UPI00035CC578|nr:DUF393 domain-containing protein [Salsuginibacillus kocurii]